MPFFLKPCLKLKKKKNKKKSKSEEKIKPVSDVTGPVTTDEIWRECEIDSNSSNLSDGRDRTVSDINGTKSLSLPTTSEIEEISANESTTNQSNEVSSQSTFIVSGEHIKLKSDEHSGSIPLEDKNSRQIDIDIERIQSIGAVQAVSDDQVGDTDKNGKNIHEDGAENLEISSNGESLSEPNDLRLSDLNNIDVNTNVMKKIEELRCIQNSFKQGDQCPFENIVGEEKNNKQIDIDIKRKQSLEALRTVSEEQVGDIFKAEKNIIDDGSENSDVSLNGETFVEPDTLRFSDLNNIDENTNLMKKIEEFRYIQNSFKQGDQCSFKNIVGEEKNNKQIDINIKRKQSMEALRTVSEEQVGDTFKAEKNIDDGSENSDVSLNGETFIEPNTLRFSDLNNIDENTNLMKKIEELRCIQNSFKQGDQCSFENIVGEEKNNKQIDIDIKRKQSLEALRTVSEEQVGDTFKAEKNIIDDGSENSDVSLNGETFIELNTLIFSDLNNIDQNTNLMKKIEELIHIQNFFKQGNQSSFENIVGQINENICEELSCSDNKNAKYLIKFLNYLETKLNEICSNIRTKRSNFICSTFRDESDYDTDSKTHVNETSSEYENYEISQNISPSKQNRKNIHKGSCNKNSSFNFRNNSISPTECVTETQEIDIPNVHNECLNVEENLDINYSIIDRSQYSDRSAHETPFLNSIKSSSDNLNACTSEEVCNYLKTDHLRNEFPSKTLNETETLDFPSNATVEPSASLSTDEIPVILEHNSLSKVSHPEMSISRKVKKNDINDKDCKDDEMKFFGNIFNSNLEEYEIKNKSTEILFIDSNQCNLDDRSGHTKEFKVRESELNLNQEGVYLPNKFNDSEVKLGEEKSEKPLMNNEEEFSPNSNKYRHLTLQENDISIQVNVHNLPLNSEDANSLYHNETFFSKDCVLSDSEEGSNFIAKKNDCAKLENDEYNEKSLHLKEDLKEDKNICYPNFTDKAGDINTFPIKTENTLCKSCGNNDISHDISSYFNNEINQTRYENQPQDEMHAKLKDFSEKVDNPDPFTQNVDNYYSIAGNETKVYKKSNEENEAFRLAEDLRVLSDINTSSYNKRNIPFSDDVVNTKNDFQLQYTTNHSKNTDFLYTEDNYAIRKSPRICKGVTNNNYNNSLHHSESVEKIYDYKKQELYEDETCKCEVEDVFVLKNTKSEEVNKDTALKSCESSTINDIYENYYASQNVLSPKRLNRFSNISSTSESSISSRFSDKSCTQETDVKKKESRSFSISACGDSKNNENIDGATDSFKMSEKEFNMVKIKEAKTAVSRNEHQGKKREPKLTINITRKNKNDAMKMAQNLTINQSGDNFKKGFKPMDLNDFHRIKESIEIFNKKKELALSDMKPNIRVIPVKRAEVFKIRTKTEKVGLHPKARSPFLKVSLNSNLNEFERSLKELMPESLFEINKNIEKHPTLHQKNNEEELFSKKSVDISPTSDSETESSQTSENISPVRKRILNVSRDIRSPKYTFRTLQKMPLSNSHYIKRPVIIKSPKVDLVAYLTKEEKNRYTIKQRYKMYNQECGNFQIFSPDYTHSDYKTNHIENTVNNRSTSPDYLKPKFDDMFKRYARKGRSNGELMSYKRSTEWLRDAGLIGKSLTAEEANNAFKCTAGVKVALNKGDYRHYLKKLARIKRLNYNEIYKRLCSLSNRFDFTVPTGDTNPVTGMLCYPYVVDESLFEANWSTDGIKKHSSTRRVFLAGIGKVNLVGKKI